MKIGVLREQEKENRVALLPEHIPALLKKNLTVLIEKGAGERACVNDQAYADAGAALVERSALLSDADMILSVNLPPDKIQKGRVLVSILSPLHNKEGVRRLLDEGVTSFSLDMVPRSTRAQAVDVLSSQATVAGYKAVLLAASELPGFFPMFMSASGTIKPSRVLILGAGVAGLQALATAKKLGAVVEVFDVRAAVKEEVQSLGGKFVEVEGARDEASAGGYAVEQSEEYKKKQAELIQAHALQADVVITTAQIPGKVAPQLIKKETVEAMKPGSVVVDMASSTGGNCALSEDGKVVRVGEVTIIASSTLASTVPGDASRMLGNNFWNFIAFMENEDGEFDVNIDDEIVQQACITRDGELINERVKSQFEL